MSIAWMQRLRETGLSQEQAEAIASMPQDTYVTREYLDARLEALEHRLVSTLTTRMLGIVGVTIVLVGLIDKFVRP